MSFPPLPSIQVITTQCDLSPTVLAYFINDLLVPSHFLSLFLPTSFSSHLLNCHTADNISIPLSAFIYTYFLSLSSSPGS